LFYILKSPCTNCRSYITVLILLTWPWTSQLISSHFCFMIRMSHLSLSASIPPPKIQNYKMLSITYSANFLYMMT
jgi:hypothetical protein